MTRLTTLDLTPFQRSFVGFDRLFEDMDRMFENSVNVERRECETSQISSNIS